MPVAARLAGTALIHLTMPSLAPAGAQVGRGRPSGFQLPEKERA